MLSVINNCPICPLLHFAPLQDLSHRKPPSPPPRSWDRCFNKTANWCSQCTLLLAAAVWIHGVVQNLLWPREYRETCAIINLLDTQQRWVQPALPGSDWSSRNDKEKRTSGRTSWKDAAADRKEHDELGGNQCKCSVFVLLNGGKRKLKSVPPRRFVSAQLASLRVPLLFKRLPAMRFPTRTWSSVYCALGSPVPCSHFFLFFSKNRTNARKITLVLVVLGCIKL